MTLTKKDLSGTCLAAAHNGDAMASALVALSNEQGDGDELALRTEMDILNAFVGDTGSTWKKIAVGAGTSAEVDSGWDLPAHAIVHHVLIQVVTAEATGVTKTLDVGLLSSESGGDADAFIDGKSVATAGIQRPLFVQTTGSNNNYLGAAGTHTVGAKLTGLLIAGEDIAAGGDGYAQFAPYASDSLTAKSVSYSRGSTLTEFAGFIWIGYTEMPL